MSAFIGAINVHDYAAVPGQIGQGTTDDTQAIKDAIQALGQMSIVPPETGVTLRTSPTLYFPAGIYNISDELRVTFSGQPMGCVQVLGENAIIRPNPDPEHPFTGEYAFRAYDCEDFRLTNLNFINFDKAVRLENANPNSMQVMVQECGFFGNKIALEMSCQSTLSVIEKCKFFENVKAIHLFSGDKVTVRDCWIEAGVMSDTVVAGVIMDAHPAQIVNYAKLDIDGCILVPHTANATEPAWINNYNSVTVENTRQGGETGSFTLVNNFAKVENDATAVIVKNCQCYAVHGNVYSGGNPVYIQPAILRYVDGIPNLSIVRDNRGLIDCRLVEFSYYRYGDNSVNINLAIANSTSSATVHPSNVVVEIANNAKGWLYGSKTTFVPEELHPYVRSEESFWPLRWDAALPILDTIPDDPNNTITYKFDLDDSGDLNSIFLMRYNGNPLVSGSGAYSGGYVGLIKANGTYVAGNVQHALRLEELYNEVASPGSFLSGTFNVSLYWDATGTSLLPASSSNRVFYVKIVGRTPGWDKIRLVTLDKL